MSNGTVKWFNATKGFGCIAPEGGAALTFGTSEHAANRLERKWPVAGDTHRKALIQVQAAMDCLRHACTTVAAAVTSVRFTQIHV